MLEINKIYNIDCLEGMKYIDDKSIDIILSDIPYGINYDDWDVLPCLTERKMSVDDTRLFLKECGIR